MSKRNKKTEQVEIFDGYQTSRPPKLSMNAGKRLHDEYGQEGPPSKRSTTSGVSKDDLMSSFFASMRQNLEEKAKKIIYNDKKVEQLKAKSLATTRLPPGILPLADKIAGAIPGEVGKYLDDYGKKTNAKYWHDFVEENFDNVVNSMKATQESEAGPSTQVSSSQASDMSLETQDTDTDMDIETLSLGSQASESSISTEDPTNLRTCTVSINTILNDNIDDMTKSIFINKIAKSLRDVSEFTHQFQYVIYSMMLIIKNSNFVVNERKILLQSTQGFKTKDIFPPGFTTRAEIPHSSAPLSNEVLRDSTFKKDLDSLFTEQHLKFVMSTLFSSRGARAETTRQHPVQESISNALPDSITALHQDKALVGAYLKSLALATYIKDLSNIWTDKRMMNALLDKLLYVLLKIHLAPKREKKFWEYVEKKNKAKESRECSLETKKDLSKLTRNAKRNILREERYRRDKYIAKSKHDPTNEKKWIEKVQKSSQRLLNYKKDMFVKVRIYIYIYIL